MARPSLCPGFMPQGVSYVRHKPATTVHKNIIPDDTSILSSASPGLIGVGRSLHKWPCGRPETSLLAATISPRFQVRSSAPIKGYVAVVCLTDQLRVTQDAVQCRDRVEGDFCERRQLGAFQSSPKRSEDMATWQMRRATQMLYPILGCGKRAERWAAS